MWLASMVLFIISQVMGGVNYISTILNMRTKGMDLWRMPLTIWAFFLTAIVGLLSFPVLVSAVVLLIFDRAAGTSFYLSDLVVSGQIITKEGGSPWSCQRWVLLRK
jgi:cytochrome c oxidase subunit 1